MKVLRTALFSTFLMLCFMNVGHAQFGTQTTFNLPITMSNMSMTSAFGGGQVLIEYDVIGAPANSITAVKYGSVSAQMGLMPLFTETISGAGIHHVSALVTVDVRGDSDVVWLSCEVYSEDGALLLREGCAVAVKP